MRRAMGRAWRYALLAVLPALAANSCPGASGNAGRTMDFYVVTFNIQNREESDAAALQRMRTLARNLKQEVPLWTMLAVQESRYTKEWSGIPELSTATPVDDPFPCSTEPVTAAECLAIFMGTRNAHTYHGNGVAVQPVFDIMGNFSYALEGPRDAPVGGLLRGVHGATMRSRVTGQRIPFISVHTVPSSADLSRQLTQVRNLVFAARQLWKPGDLPPVLAGDFNCGRWNREIRDVMYSEFIELSGVNSIDLVFVGRPERYPGAPGIIRRSTTTSGGAISGRHDPSGLSDHYATWVRLQYDISVPASQVSVPRDPDAGGSGCFPTPR